MAVSVTDYVVTAGGLMGAAAWLPRMVAAVTRHKQVDVQSEMTRFEVILKAQDSQLARANECISELEDDINKLEAELREERNARNREKEYFFQELTRAQRQVSDCLGMLRRFNIKDQRKEPRHAS